MLTITNKKTYAGREVTLRDFSEPLQDVKETTSYGERMLFTIDLDPTPQVFELAKYENEMIRIWRNMAKNPYIDFAVDDIVNEMISHLSDDVYPIDLDLDNTKFSQAIRDKIHEEWTTILKLLEFNKKSYSILRDWYIDGKALFYVKPDKGKKGLADIIQLDPTRTKKVVKEDKSITYVYQDIDLTNTLLEIPEEYIIEIVSGIMDEKHQIWVSYLNKAYVALNQLSSVEDALVIYRLSRAPERRVFYIDVGELPKAKAEAYMKELIRNYRNKMEYDPNTGRIKEQTRHSSILDDIWLPRRDGNRGTEVSTLQGGTNLNNLDDVQIFMQKLFRALNIPFSRFADNQSAQNIIGRSTEITRDEVKYSKFVIRLRHQFNSLFYVLLRHQLHLKNIIKSDELNEERESIIFKWNSDSLFSEFRKLDVLTERSNLIEKYMPHVGKLVSLKWIKSELMGMTDDEIEDMEKQMEKEKPMLDAMAKDELEQSGGNNFGQ